MGKPKSSSWKTGGNEDTVLIDLIKTGKVTKHTKPTELKKMNEIFKKHSDSAIRNHLNEMKRRQGLHCKFYNDRFFKIFQPEIFLQ